MRVAPNKLSRQQIEKEIVERFADDVEILNIVDSRNILLKSNVCGHTFNKTIFNLRKNVSPLRCQECSSRDRSKLHLTEEQFYEKYPNFKEKYKIIGKWKNSQTETEIQCVKCKFKWDVIPYNLATGVVTKCPKCEGGFTKYTTKVVRQLLEGTEIELLSKCKEARDEVEFRHVKCGYEFKKRLGLILKNPSCPRCFVRSEGERRIKNYLSKLNIDFKQEVAFKDLKGVKNGYLRYDFGILVDGEFKFLIEYDGEQHYIESKSDFFRDDFETIKEHDKRKTEYAIKNKKILLRISHEDINNIDNILHNFLTSNKLIPSQASRETTGRCND